MPKCILIVDDSAVIRGALRSFLESQPDLKVCGEAGDGMEAIAKTVELNPDLIVLDWAMPKMNGLEAAAALQKITPNVPIILFTFYTDAVSIHKARVAGITSIVSKTDHINRLSEEISRIVHAN